MSERIIKQAEEILDIAAEACLVHATAELKKIMRGRKCSCANCTGRAVREANEIADYISFGNDPVTWVVEDGKIKHEINRNRFNRLME